MIEIPPAAKAAADRGDLIDAIKITRQVTSWGLKEAKDAVDAYRRGATSPSSPESVQIPLQAISALYQGNLIEAIKRTREATGLGLKDAKEAVESHLARHPNANEQFRAAARQNGSGVARVLTIAGLAIAVAAIFWWLSRA